MRSAMQVAGTTVGLDPTMLMAMLDADRDAVVLSDERGRVRWANRAVETLLGWHPEQFVFVGSHLVHPSDQTAVEAALAVAIATAGHHHLGEVRHLRADGDWVTVEVTVVNLLDDHGVVVTRYHDLAERGAHRHDAPVTVDELTGLPTRNAVLAELDHRIHHGHDVAALFLDLDGFKAINDQHGHAAGDAILRQVAERLRRRLRGTDVLSRWGGDEFVVLVEVPGPALAATAAARLRQAVVDEPFHVAGVDVQLGLSIGLAIGDERDDPEAIIARADEAMYRAKRDGGGVRADRRAINAA